MKKSRYTDSQILAILKHPPITEIAVYLARDLQKTLTSTLPRLVDQRSWAATGSELRRWVYGGGEVSPGFVTRRAAEAV